MQGCQKIFHVKEEIFFIRGCGEASAPVQNLASYRWMSLFIIRLATLPGKLSRPLLLFRSSLTPFEGLGFSCLRQANLSEKDVIPKRFIALNSCICYRKDCDLKQKGIPDDKS